MEINKPNYIIDEDYLVLKENAFTFIKGHVSIPVRNVTGIQISFEHPFLPPEKEKPKPRISSLSWGFLLSFSMFYILFMIIISVSVKSPFIFLAMVLSLPMLNVFYWEFEKFIDKRYEKQKVYLHGKYMLELETYNRKVADWKSAYS